MFIEEKPTARGLVRTDTGDYTSSAWKRVGVEKLPFFAKQPKFGGCQNALEFENVA
jgi:hypothetical protein